MNTGYVYAVHKGLKTGLFLHWEGTNGCKEQVHHYVGAVYKKFKSIELAREYVKNGADKVIKKRKRPVSPSQQELLFKVPSKCPCDIEKEPLVVYVDGSSKKDTEGIVRAGYGVWFGENDTRNIKEKFPLPNPTNNRCEIMAARKAIDLVMDQKYVDDDAELIIMTDSMYVINGMKTQGGEWKGGSEKNRGLFKSLYALTQMRPVTFMHVRGHTGIKGNEGADELAKSSTL